MNVNQCIEEQVTLFNGETFSSPDDVNRFLREALRRVAVCAKQEEREEWINQPANVHDEQIRKAERERIKEIVKNDWIIGNHRGVAEHAIALYTDRIIKDIDAPHSLR